MLFLAASLQAPPPERKRLRKAGEAEANEGGAADTRNPELPTSVPMPSSTAQVTNGHIHGHGCLLGRGLALLACAAGELSAAAHLTAIAGNELSEGAPVAKVACVS